jgi:aminoglycoside phosphotransferase (APT) family kinase protein
MRSSDWGATCRSGCRRSAGRRSRGIRSGSGCHGWLRRCRSPSPCHGSSAGRPAYGYPFRWYLAPWLPGRNPRPGQPGLHRLAADLAAFVLALQSVDTTGAPAPRGSSRGGPLSHADASTRSSAGLLRGETDVDGLLSVWDAGRSAAAWQGPPRWVHGDLLEGNLLVGRGRLTAVIDWGGLKAGDPAVDLMVAWTLFDRDSRRAYRQALGFVDDAMWLRGRAWAASAALQALPYYRDTNPDIVARSWRTVREVLADLGTPP